MGLSSREESLLPAASSGAANARPNASARRAAATSVRASMSCLNQAPSLTSPTSTAPVRRPSVTLRRRYTPAAGSRSTSASPSVGATSPAENTSMPLTFSCADTCEPAYAASASPAMRRAHTAACSYSGATTP